MRDTVSPYHADDPIPVTEAVEKDTDTTWALWSDLSASENRKFEDTAPASRSMRFSAEDLSYAPTAPAPLQRLEALPSAPVRRELSVGEAMVEARRHNRVCPKPEHWQRLYEMLPNKKQTRAGWEPPPPLVDAAWRDTPSIPKRMVFRQHIEWAAAHGCLQEVFSLMKSLDESEWHHMGE
ncbi:MAG: hypothetical protein Q8M07_22140 [Prosthecobacter sp.]|nr:hypothetical protein [Prosthecobacter sp.]